MKFGIVSTSAPWPGIDEEDAFDLVVFQLKELMRRFADEVAPVLTTTRVGA